MKGVGGYLYLFIYVGLFVLYQLLLKASLQEQ